MFDQTIILIDPSGAPAILEFHHQDVPTFRALLTFSCPEDAMRWLDNQPKQAAPAWAGYHPATVKTIAPIERRFREKYGHDMSVLNMSQVMRLGTVAC